MKRIIVLIILGTIVYVTCKLISNSFSSGWMAGVIYGLIIAPFTNLKLDENENSRTNKT